MKLLVLLLLSTNVVLANTLNCNANDMNYSIAEGNILTVTWPSGESEVARTDGGIFEFHLNRFSINAASKLQIRTNQIAARAIYRIGFGQTAVWYLDEQGKSLGGFITRSNKLELVCK